MPQPKQSPATKKHAEGVHSPSNQNAPKWKWAALGFIFLVIVGGGVWSTGIIQNTLAGPKIPLPRAVAQYPLGLTQDQFLKDHPDMKKALRKFNNDNEFEIVTVTTKNDLTDASSMDLLFYKKQLYFISTMWDGDKAKTIPLKDWAHQFRRWNSHGSDSEPLGDQVLLKEWHFTDVQTEMVLRDLNYPDHVQRWQDLRDASNSEAQAAFAKYRLDAAS